MVSCGLSTKFTSYLGGIKVRFVDISLFVAIVAFFDNGIEDVSKHGIRLLVSSNNSNRRNERMARIINSSLNGLIECKTRRCGLKCKWVAILDFISYQSNSSYTLTLIRCLFTRSKQMFKNRSISIFWCKIPHYVKIVEHG